MNRRRFVAAGAAAAVAVLPGCSRGDGSADDGTTVAGDDAADVRVAVLRTAPENPGPYEDPPTVEPQESDALALENVVFQRAGQKGLVVAGDAVNTGDRPLTDLTAEVTLYDDNEAEGEPLDSAATATERDDLDAGATWGWAATFDEEPEFEIDYYAVVVTADLG